MRRGAWVGGAIVAVVAGGALIAYLAAPASRAIHGYARSAGGEPIVGAAVELVALDGSEPARSASTDRRGWYSFQELRGPRYALTVRAAGADPVVVTGIAPGARVDCTVATGR